MPRRHLQARSCEKLLTAPVAMAAAPQLHFMAQQLIRFRHWGSVHLPDTQHSNVYVCGEDLPKDCGPFEENIANVKGIQDPRPLVIAQVEVFLETSRLCITNIACCEFRQSVQSSQVGGRGYTYSCPDKTKRRVYRQLVELCDQTGRGQHPFNIPIKHSETYLLSNQRLSCIGDIHLKLRFGSSITLNVMTAWELLHVHRFSHGDRPNRKLKIVQMKMVFAQ